MCRLELLVRLVPLPPITYNFYLRKLRFLRKVRKSMSFKMILNSLFAHIFFNSHFIRYQRLKEQGASSHGLSANTFSDLLKSPQKSFPMFFFMSKKEPQAAQPAARISYKNSNYNIMGWIYHTSLVLVSGLLG